MEDSNVKKDQHAWGIISTILGIIPFPSILLHELVILTAFFCSIIGLILGIVGLRRCKDQAWSTIGIVLNLIVLVLFLFMMHALFTGFIPP